MLMYFEEALYVEREQETSSLSKIFIPAEIPVDDLKEAGLLF